MQSAGNPACLVSPPARPATIAQSRVPGIAPSPPHTLPCHCMARHCPPAIVRPTAIARPRVSGIAPSPPHTLPCHRMARHCPPAIALPTAIARPRVSGIGPAPYTPLLSHGPVCPASVHPAHSSVGPSHGPVCRHRPLTPDHHRTALCVWHHPTPHGPGFKPAGSSRGQRGDKPLMEGLCLFVSGRAAGSESALFWSHLLQGMRSLAVPVNLPFLACPPVVSPALGTGCWGAWVLSAALEEEQGLMFRTGGWGVSLTPLATSGSPVKPCGQQYPRQPMGCNTVRADLVLIPGWDNLCTAPVPFLPLAQV
ncbi:uncharacterized protein LOC123362937 [Mauremys mutica]|uniref:uncharacterized protein LOC123362937 n=1 Tax=Mauremys mutica TaxID=74926 RepID=UPI001D16E78E|nr:uncharacterized protein LOC123362937 [Mauremys mutica]